MLSEKMEDALNEQINKEMYSAYLYMAMSAYSAHSGLAGIAHWFQIQYDEEMIHAMKFYDYINKQGARIKLKEIQAPPQDFGAPLEMFEQTLEHEKFITRSINELVDLAMEERDHATTSFLQWYVTEQVEEEENDNDIIARLKLTGDSGNALFMLDSELAKRPAATPPGQGGQSQA